MSANDSRLMLWRNAREVGNGTPPPRPREGQTEGEVEFGPGGKGADQRSGRAVVADHLVAATAGHVEVAVRSEDEACGPFKPPPEAKVPISAPVVPLKRST
jgi:hypothetical protein